MISTASATFKNEVGMTVTIHSVLSFDNLYTQIEKAYVSDKRYSLNTAPKILSQSSQRGQSIFIPSSHRKEISFQVWSEKRHQLKNVNATFHLTFSLA